MKVGKVFISLNARDFEAQSDWWKRLLDRPWDRQPMPSCHEWDLTDDVLFQVLDNDDDARVAVTLHVGDLDAERTRLGGLGIDTPEPGKVEGFETLRFISFPDPEGNTVGLLDGR